MKKNGLLNSEISKILDDLRHTDQIVIGDCGLPVPNGVKQIDLSLKLGVPKFLDVLELIINEMQVEQAIIATEISDNNPEVEAKIKATNLPLDYVNHERFKELTKEAKVIIRTGEATPYANIILQSGVIF
ncbi:D-ribose pyranase [Vagococcus zengguangii]|uniref:D-ribose pyranase n=1 Tax=Vagococcus zengguangii TaxID=2571750 RepID=A0A4D7CY16_9ENTE|nr:D-ribose pyranase [Vagococcus zengguangii]QCI86656.1 D-ribose pyranase [Vagococcus zengguangii]TLG79711.1 D-ribose pyranase [Vagococcus zengguangii]